MPFEKGKSGNPRGRPVNSKSKQQSVKELIDDINTGTLLSVKKLKEILVSDKSSESAIIKVAFKFLDMRFDLEKNGGKFLVTKTTDDKSESLIFEEEEKLNTGTGNIVLLNTNYTPSK